MTTYARLTADLLALEATRELTPDEYAAHPENKRAFLRLYIIDAKPAPGPSQNVVDGLPVITATEYHKTWMLVDKSQAELDAEAQAAELVQLRQLVTALTTDIDAGLTAAPTTQAQAFAQIQDLKRRALRTDRVLRYLVKAQ